MNINLVFPPLISPSCVPIGIASLKAYVEKYSPGNNVNLIDLNLPFTNEILAGRFNNLNQICKFTSINCPYKDTGCPFQSSLLKAQSVIFKTAKQILKNKELFLNKAIFRKYIGDCYVYIFRINECLTKILASYNQQRLHNDEMIVYNLRNEIDKILFNKPDIIGFSILGDSQINYALALAKMVKQKLNIPIVFGGPALFNFKIAEFMEAFNFIDFIVTKEGELSIIELANNTTNGTDLCRIPNLFWRKNSKVVSNHISFINNLNDLPTPNFDGLKLREYFSPKIILPIASSRGCPWLRCKFCQLNAQYSGPYREMSIDKVTEDISKLQKQYGASDFFFTDSEISADRLRRLGQGIIDRKLHIYFACYTRPTKSLNIDILKTVYKAGGRFLQLGVESLSDKFLKFADKGTSAQSIREVLRNTNKVGIKNLVYMLACCPRQTRKELLRDFKNISSMQRKYNIFSIIYCQYSMGMHQRLYKESKNLGIVIKTIKPYFITAYGRRIYRTDRLNYVYKNKPADNILSNRKLNYYIDKFELDHGNKDFVLFINNLLFETQLLYSEIDEKKQNSSLLAKKAIKLYAKNKSEIIYYSYKSKLVYIE
jgi:radical SAM superfamily enzyme YgiQ (UPF0313 family)